MRARRRADPDQDSPGRRDLAYRVLSAVVSAMPPGRRDWGLAMLAELDQIRSPGERAWFAIGAARVALFPPRRTRPWWAVPTGLAVRAVAAGAAIHALAPAAGPAAAMLGAAPAATAWALFTMPALAGRQGGALPAQIAVAAGLISCLAVALTTLQRYPQALGTDHGWGIGLVFDAASAGYLTMARLLPCRLAGSRRNTLYALAAGLVTAAAAGYYIARPSLTGLWTGPLPGMTAYIVACLALSFAAALASCHRGRLQDGLETALWAALLAGLIMPIMTIAATYRVASSAAGNPQIVADAHLHGMASAPVWLASDNLEGAMIGMMWMPAVFFVLAAGGALIGSAVRATARH
jgi:hypothetical protein